MQRPPTPDTHRHHDTHSPVSGQHRTDFAQVSSCSIEVRSPHISARKKREQSPFRSNFERSTPNPSLIDIVPVRPGRRHQGSDDRAQIGRKSPQPPPKVDSNPCGKGTGEDDNVVRIYDSVHRTPRACVPPVKSQCSGIWTCPNSTSRM